MTIPARRLTMQQTAAAIGTNIGGVIKLRSKGATLYDPTFPPMINSTFDEAAVLAWKATRDAKATLVAHPIPTEK
jgi:hypothetical protein